MCVCVFEGWFWCVIADASPRPRHRKSVGPLTPPLTSKGSPAPHVVFLYRAVGSNINQSNLPSLCVGHLVAAYGPLCPGQPLFKHVASRVLAALCHIDARSTHTLTTVSTSACNCAFSRVFTPLSRSYRIPHSQIPTRCRYVCNLNRIYVSAFAL